MQEATRCDKALRCSHKCENDSSHVVRVFTRLMLKGNVRAAVRWVSKKARGVLKPTDLLDVKKSNGESVKMTVFEVLQQKHPDPVIPPKLALLPCAELPKLEEVEITGGHVLRVARSIQGGGQALVDVMRVIGRTRCSAMEPIVSGCVSLLPPYVVD